MGAAENTRSKWQGFHHVAVVTADLDATLRFYVDVLGMEAGEIMRIDARGGGARHCFVRPGGTESLGLHFFHAPDAVADQEANIEEKFGLRSVGPHHIAFALPDEAAGMELRERLEKSGVEMTPVGDTGPLRNTHFLDNNGLLLEAAWPKQ
ncbi:MAG TPA: VOC family protein [Rubrobacter sp.]|nr:VOC family protein [Rubrobacter sp.]